MNHDRLVARLVAMEGFRRTSYLDPKGIPTVGVGHNLAVPLTDGVVYHILDDDIEQAAKQLDRVLPWWRQEDDVRQECLLELMFNMGWGDGKRGLSTFVRTLRAWEQGDYEAAARGLLASKWTRDVKERRANSLAEAVRTGEWPSV